ncbi:hypothetical protein ANN_14643 [Periplaneta americana]|uniref:Uncharacterized protein n=1 Tax=Periplaneta americana TaxID=6978 RepID=A0ABQ8SY35_PERAM|nr:hypothetical protein ANN_14643 [Periplaneta americana]
MVGLWEGGNEPPGSLKASKFITEYHGLPRSFQYHRNNRDCLYCCRDSLTAVAKNQITHAVPQTKSKQESSSDLGGQTAGPA